VNQTTGQSYEVSAGEIVDTSVVFHLDLTGQNVTGQYQVTALTYTVNGVPYSVSLDAIGIEAIFGVNTTVDANPDMWVVEDSEEEAIDISDAVATNAEEIVQAIQSENLMNASRITDLVVVLDPGHGGKDGGSGATHNGVTYT
jgi:N-acetylmuramoyl-L-alanine amidase